MSEVKTVVYVVHEWKHKSHKLITRIFAGKQDAINACEKSRDRATWAQRTGIRRIR